MKTRPVDPQKSPGPTYRASTRPSRKQEPGEATAHLLRKPCPSRSSSPAWEASGLPRCSLDPPVRPMQAWRPLAQRSWSPEPSVVPAQAWEATALHQKKLCPLSLTNLPREAAVNLSCRSQTSLQAAQVQGSLELLPRSPELSDLQMLASEGATALPLRKLCHLSLMEKPLETTAHPQDSPKLSRKSTTALPPRPSGSRVRSTSLPPQTRLLSGSRAPSAAHPEKLSDLLLTSQETAPRWRSPDPRSRFTAPPLGSTTLPSTWTAPQSRLMARPSRSPEPQIRESEQRDPELREKQPRWKEAQPPLQKEEKSSLPRTDPLPPRELLPPRPLQTTGQPLPLQRFLMPGQPPEPQRILTPGQPLEPQQILTPKQPLEPQQILTPGQPLEPQRILTPGQTLEPQRILTPGQPLEPQRILTPGQPLEPQRILTPGQPLEPQRILMPEQPQEPQPRLTPGQQLKPKPILKPGQLLQPGQRELPLPLGPDPSSITSDPPARRFRLPTRLLRGLLDRLRGGASPRVAVSSTTRRAWSSAKTPAKTSPTRGPSAACAGFSTGETARVERRPDATFSAISSHKASGDASVVLRLPSPKARTLPRSRRLPWWRSANRRARKLRRFVHRSVHRRNAASSSTSNSRRRRWTTCARIVCCF
ncbi:protein ALEX-like [Lemur catta]|uniref:protein ALEX-like n=1 Tax=Lemur catta TaxID=9447 RepID=UPI001E26D9E6|nr:protein ALEX-like [Lemur catta]